MVDPGHGPLSITRQCRLVSIARSSFYYEGRGESPLNLRLLRLIDEQFLETPFYGSRQMKRWLRRQGYMVSRKRVRRLMRLLGLQAIFQRPRTSQPHPEHRIYPYLLRELQITRPDHVWCADVERHEALWNRAVMKGHRHRLVAASRSKLRAAWPWKRGRGRQAALTTPGRVSTVR